MALNLRCRGPDGMVTLAGLEPSMPLGDFRSLLSSKTGVAPGSLSLLAGFPPKPVDGLYEKQTLGDLGLSSGDTVTLRADEGAAADWGGGAANNDDDADLARALAASMEDARGGPAPPARGGPAPPARGGPTPAAPGGNAPAPTSVQLADGSCVTRRIIDSDNSCLFNAVGYVMEHSRARAPALRKVIADRVSSDHLEYNEGFLGMPNDDYCAWIMKSDKWGGGIELSILCGHYGREIAAYDIRTKRCDLYGQDSGYTERVMLIYDGLHYDALAVSAFDGAPEELDVTIFSPLGPDGELINGGAARLVEAANGARQFTDTTNFTLRCGVCQIGLKGEAEAVMHAKSSGHSNFSEY
ncbi:hypothetical protein FOA52_005890 [Chlamydomonas sp. UWO 241]|nr:hypothetical protein FOA52_005890 [Chlamydomonas sp. UWO 241]